MQRSTGLLIASFGSHGPGRRRRADDRAAVPLRHRQGPHRPLGLPGERRPQGRRLEHHPRPVELGAPGLRQLQVRRPPAAPGRAGPLSAPLRRPARLARKARRPRVRGLDDRHRGLDRRQVRGTEAPGRLLRVPLRRHDAPPTWRPPAARGARQQGVVGRVRQRGRAPLRLLDLRRDLPPRVPRGPSGGVRRARGDRRATRRRLSHGRAPQARGGRGRRDRADRDDRRPARRRTRLRPGRCRRGERHARDARRSPRGLDGRVPEPLPRRGLARARREGRPQHQRALRLPHRGAAPAGRPLRERREGAPQGRQPPQLLARLGPRHEPRRERDGRDAHQGHEHERGADVPLPARPAASSRSATSRASTSSTS